MDFDSFLDFPSPDLNDLGEWSHLSDAEAGNLDLICEESTQFEPLECLMKRAKNASYSPVLRLSDIASALQGFSMSSTSSAATPRRSSLIASEIYGNKRPQCLRAILRRREDDLDSGENEDVKPRPVPSASFQKRSLTLPEQCFGVGKRPKLSPTCSSYLQDDGSKGERQRKPSCVDGLKRSEFHSQSGRQGLSQREIHIHSERERRRSMRDYFTALQSLVPKIKLKHADRITVLTEVITYIQSLRDTLEELDRKKCGILDILGLPLCEQTIEKYGATSCLDHSRECSGEYPGGSRIDVTVRLSGCDVLITLSTPRRKGVWSAVLMFLQRYRVEVVSATLEINGESSFHCIHGKVINVPEFDNIDLQDKLEELIVKELRRPHIRLYRCP